MPEKIALYMDQFVGSGAEDRAGVSCSGHLVVRLILALQHTLPAHTGEYFQPTDGLRDRNMVSVYSSLTIEPDHRLVHRKIIQKVGTVGIDFACASRALIGNRLNPSLMLERAY